MAIQHQEWLNQNSYRSYPIKESVSRYAVDSAGRILTDIQIPNQLIVDLVLTVAADTSLRVYVSKVALIGDFVSIALYDESDNSITTVAVDISTHTPNTAYPLVGADTYEDARGTIVVGDLSTLRNSLSEGSFNFTLATAELEPAVVRPDIRGVRSLRTDSNGELSELLFGHVRLVAGENIRLTPFPSDNSIRIDAIDATGFEDECECVDDFQRPCLRTINGINISDLQIVGDKCIEVNTSGNEIQLTDKCSAPCCGCIELEFLTRNIDLLEDQLSRLEGYATDMRERLVTFITNVLVSI